MSKYGVFSGPYLVQMRKNRDQKKTPHLDTFHVVKTLPEKEKLFFLCFAMPQTVLREPLNHFSPMFYFYTPWKRQKTFGFLTVSEGIEIEH